MLLPKKTSLSIATFGALVVFLEFAKLAPPFSPEAVLDFHPRPVSTAPLPEAPKRKAVITKLSIKELPAQADLTGREYLKAFYQALWRTEAKQAGAVTRILHYGDSPVTADSITADMRSLMQERFGDAGHGFILIAKPWAWYGHRGVEVTGKGWKIEAASQGRAADGVHGLGGVSFQGSTGASSHFVLKADHSFVEVQFWRQPDGGKLDIRAGGQTIHSIETAGAVKEPAFETVGLPPGTRELDLVVDRGPVRLFGAVFERDEPGVIYNSLGLNGAQVQSILRSFEKNQWTQQLQHEKPDLVILNYGTNESIYADYVDKSYAGELRQVIQRVKAAVPNASVLVMSPMDHAEKSKSGEMATPAALGRLVNIQKRTAEDLDCAFFNTFQAMGGEGTMVRWYHNQPPLVSADYMHPFPAGARKVGVLLYQAIEDGFEQFKLKQRLSNDRARSGAEQPE